MFLVDRFVKPSATLHAGKRAGIAATLAFATATAAFCALAGSAHARDCLNGYRELPNNVIVVCHDPQGASGNRDAPQFTGSIGRTAAEPRSVPAGNLMVDSAAACEPGKYWVIQLPNSAESVMACR